jgi:hypothetical protein
MRIFSQPVRSSGTVSQIGTDYPEMTYARWLLGTRQHPGCSDSVWQKNARWSHTFLTPSAPGQALILGRLDLLAQVLAAEARLALLEDRTNDAVATCLLWIRYGQERGRGGPIFDDGSGTEIQTSALAVLAPLVDSVDPRMARKAAGALQAVLSRSESPKQVWKRDLDWSRRGRFGWFDRIKMLLDRAYRHQVKRSLEQRHAQLDATLRRVMSDFVSRSNRAGGPQP